MKIVKRVVIVIVLILMVLLDAFILNNFEEKIIRMGVIDKDENIKVGLDYEIIIGMDLNDGYKYMDASKRDIFGVLKETLYIDVNGNEYYVASKENNWDAPIFYENRAAVYSNNAGKQGYIDFDENKTSKFIYDYTDSYKNGYAIVGIYNENDELMYGVIDLTGKQILPCKYEYISLDFSNEDLFYVEVDNKEYIVNKNNKIILEYIQDKIKFIDLADLSALGEVNSQNVLFTKGYVFALGDNDKYAMYNIDGTQKTNFVFDVINKISSELNIYYVDISGKEYILDENFKIVLDYNKFSENGYEIESIDNDRVLIKTNGKYGITDYECNIIVEPKYDAVSFTTLKNGYFSVSKDNKYGVLDLNGNEIIKCSDKYKTMICGDGEYFAVRTTNTGLLTMYISIIVMTAIVAIILVILFFKKSKKII